jgi:hypothetical protein
MDENCLPATLGLATSHPTLHAQWLPLLAATCPVSVCLPVASTVPTRQPEVWVVVLGRTPPAEAQFWLATLRSPILLVTEQRRAACALLRRVRMPLLIATAAQAMTHLACLLTLASLAGRSGPQLLALPATPHPLPRLPLDLSTGGPYALA